MPLVDQDEFERGRRLAAEDWRKKGDPALAARFETLELSACGFGLDAAARLVFSRAGAPRVGLRFDLLTGAFSGSFVQR